MLTIEQISDLLYKKFMGKGSSSTDKEFFQELISSNPRVYGKDVWADDIPETNPLSDAGDGEKWINAAGNEVLQKKVLVELVHIDGSTAFTHPGLKDIISFTHGDGTYNYGIYLPDGVTRLPIGARKWLLDPETSILNFYDGYPEGIDETNPPKLTCTVYIGKKGAGSGTGTSNNIKLIEVSEYECSISDGDLLVSHPTGLSKLVDINEAVDKNNVTASGKTIKADDGGVKVTNKGELWYTTNEDTSTIFHQRDNFFTAYKVTDYINGLTNTNIRYFNTSPSGVVYAVVGTPSKLWRFDGYNSHILNTPELDGLIVSDIAVNGDDIIITCRDESETHTTNHGKNGLFITNMSGSNKSFINPPFSKAPGTLISGGRVIVFNNVPYVLLEEGDGVAKGWFKYISGDWTNLNENATTEDFVFVPPTTSLVNIAVDQAGNVYSFEPSAPLKIKKMGVSGAAPSTFYDISSETGLIGTYNNITSIAIDGDSLYVGGVDIFLRVNIVGATELFLNENGDNVSGSSGKYVGTFNGQPYYTNMVDSVYKFGYMPVNIKLPASPYEGKNIKVHDHQGFANLGIITVNGNGQPIENKVNAVINTSYGDISLLFHNGSWFVNDGNL